MATFKLTDDMRDEVWARVAKAYSVVHDIMPQDHDVDAPRQCSHRDSLGRCGAPSTHRRGSKVYCDTHADKIRAARRRELAKAVATYHRVIDTVTSAATYRDALDTASRVPADGLVATLSRRPS